MGNYTVIHTEKIRRGHHLRAEVSSEPVHTSNSAVKNYRVVYSDSGTIVIEKDSSTDLSLWFKQFAIGMRLIVDSVSISDEVLQKSLNAVDFKVDSGRIFSSSMAMPNKGDSISQRTGFFNSIIRLNYTPYQRNLIAREHVEKYSGIEINSAEDFQKLMEPINSQHGFENYEFMKEYAQLFHISTNLKYGWYRDVVKCLANVACSENLTEEQLSTSVGEFPIEKINATPENMIITKKIGDLPLRSKEYRGHLLQLSAEDFRKFISMKTLNISGSASSKSAIAYTNECIELVTNETDLWGNATDAVINLMKIIYKIGPKDSDHNLVSFLTGKILSLWDQPNTVALIQEYFKSYDPSKLSSIRVVYNSVYCIVESTRFNSWLRATKDTDYVIGVLYKELGTKALDVLNEVSKACYPLTIKEWEKVVDSYEDVKDLPVSWWVSMAN